MKPIREAIEVLLIAIVLLFVASTSNAQTTKADVPAYFQWMNAVAADPRPEAIEAHLFAAGIQKKEHANVAKILQAFKDDEFGLEASYNNLPSTKAGRNDGEMLFNTKQAMLVQHAVILLRAALSPSSAKHLDDRVAHEMKNIVTADVVRHSHPMLRNVSMGGMPQGVMGMNPAYSLYSTMAGGLPGAGTTASMLSVDGVPFPQWNAANLVDGNPNDVGFSTDTSQQGASAIIINYGTPTDIIELQMTLSAANYNGKWNIYYQDSGHPWTLVVTAFSPSDAGENDVIWSDVGPHQYWVIALANTPGPGPTINEMTLIKPGLTLFASFSVTGTTHCPSGCSGALHNGYVTNSLGSPVTGPQISATGFMNVVNPGSQFLPAGGPPITVSSDNDEVDCNIVQGPIQKQPFIHNDIEIAITYSQDLGINCPSPDPERPFCREIIDYCLPNSVPPDFDPTQVISSHAWIAKVPFWNGMTLCDRPPNSPPGTSWECIWPNFPGENEPRFESARHPCTNADKHTHGVWP